MATKAAAFGSFGVLYGNVEFDREATLREQVDATRDFIASNVIWYVRNVLQGDPSARGLGYVVISYISG